jgi:hypothetical protein
MHTCAFENTVTSRSCFGNDLKLHYNSLQLKPCLPQGKNHGKLACLEYLEKHSSLPCLKVYLILNFSQHTPERYISNKQSTFLHSSFLQVEIYDCKIILKMY